MDIKLDYSQVRFQENGRLKLLIIVGTVRKSSAWRLSSTNAAVILTVFWPTPARITTIT